MEHNHGDLEDHFPFGRLVGSMLIFQGVLVICVVLGIWMARRQLKQTISDFTIRDAMSNRSSNCIHRQSQSQLDKSNHCRDRVRPSRTHLHLKLSQLSNKQGMCKKYMQLYQSHPEPMTFLNDSSRREFQHPNLNADNPLIVLFDMCCQFESIVFLGVLLRTMVFKRALALARSNPEHDNPLAWYPLGYSNVSKTGGPDPARNPPFLRQLLRFNKCQCLLPQGVLVGVFFPSHLKKYAEVKLDHFPKVRGENKQY